MMGLFDGTPLERPVLCERCGAPRAQCRCPPPEQPRTPPSEQTVHLAVEIRRNGKHVTLVRGLADEGDHLAEVLSRLMSTCGAGGTLKEGAVEVQGRQLESVRVELERAGYRVRG